MSAPVCVYCGGGLDEPDCDAARAEYDAEVLPGAPAPADETEVAR